MTLPFFGLIVYLIFVYFAPSLWFPFLAQFRVAFIIAVLTLAFALFQRPTIPKARQTKYFVVLVLVAFLSTLSSLSIERSFPQFIDLTKVVMTYFLFTLIINSADLTRKLLYTILTYASITTFGTLIAQQFGKFMPGIKDPYRLTSYFGGIGNAPNEFGALLVVLLPLPLVLLEGEHSLPKKVLFGLIALSIMLCITRTRSRGAFVGLVLVLAFLMWEYRKKLAVTLLLPLLVVFTFLHTHHGYWHRIYTLSSAETVTAQDDRSLQIGYAFELIRLRPLVGVGLRNFVLAKSELLGLDPWSGITQHVAHNSYLEIGVEIGIIGMAIFILIILSSLKDCYSSERYFRSRGDSFLLYKFSKGIRIGLLGFAVCILFLSEQYNSILYQWIAISVILRQLTAKERFVAKSAGLALPRHVTT